jgi:uncharacterized membrane-anchored protein YitT (DUF2179 family)
VEASDRPAAPPAAAPALGGHSLFEDAQAIVFAAALASLGVGFLRHGGLVTGGTAGGALLLARVTPLTFGQLYVILNVPFFLFGVQRLGWRFTAKTLAAIALFSFASDHLPAVLRFAAVSPAYGALVGGALIGMGLLILFRHQASLGGLNILAIFLQRRLGLRAGVFLMAVDAAIVVASWFLVAPRTLLLSVAGVVSLNLVLAVNHKPGRYSGA